MPHRLVFSFFFFFVLFFLNCQVKEKSQIEKLLPLLKGKRIGVVSNNSTIILSKNKEIHFIDTLLKLKVNIQKIFAPEHGFKLDIDAGGVVDNSKYKNKIPILSLYGKNKKLNKKHIEEIDLIIFNIQDVGVRCYTYISTLHYVMERCAKENIPLIVIDRPNPNRHIVDGAVLDTSFHSFVGMHPVPLIYGTQC